MVQLLNKIWNCRAKIILLSGALPLIDAGKNCFTKHKKKSKQSNIVISASVPKTQNTLTLSSWNYSGKESKILHTLHQYRTFWRMESWKYQIFILPKRKKWSQQHFSLRLNFTLFLLLSFTDIEIVVVTYINQTITSHLTK